MGTSSSAKEHEGVDVVIVAAKRTAHGSFGGTLKDFTATDLAVAASQAALQQLGPGEAKIDHVIFGNVAQTSADAAYLARHVGLRAGLPQGVPALTLNRLCGSGFQAVVSAAEQVRLGYADAVLCGGTESMSMSPHMLRGARWGAPLGKPPALEDSLWSALTDSYAGLPMGMTAENLAERYKISRERSDAFSLRSQQRWAAADQAGRFKDELVALPLKGGKGKASGDAPPTFVRDEHPRPQTTLAVLAGLKPVFKPDGVVTAGSASGISDGAAALVVASAAAAKRNGWTPLARVVGWGIVGCDPAIMGIGPAGAIRQLLERTGLGLDAFGLVEINEAFSAQVLAVLDELGLAEGAKSAPGTTGIVAAAEERINVNGGAIALGHPLGASGARITTHLVYELRRRGVQRALGAACIGGGQGIAIALEAV